MKHVAVSGAGAALGHAIGHEMRDAIVRGLEGNEDLHDLLLPAIQAGEGADFFRRMVIANRALYPFYMQEIEAMAEASQLPLDWLLAVNFRNEIALWKKGEGAQGCFDIAISEDGACLIGHNEDNVPAYAETAFLVTRLADETGPGWTAYTYPGHLPGMTFGHNDMGLVFTFDSVAPLSVRPGLARQFIARDCLEAADHADAVSRLAPPGRASGSHALIADVADCRITSFEIGPDSLFRYELSGVIAHANHYQGLEIAQHISPCSSQRLERAHALGAPENRDEVLSLLGDAPEGEDYPIFRNGAPPDGAATLVTALYDLKARKLDIYTGNPLEGEIAYSAAI